MTKFDLAKNGFKSKLLKDVLSTPAAVKLAENYGWMLFVAPFASQVLQLADKAIDNFEEVTVKVGNASVTMKGKKVVVAQ